MVEAINYSGDRNKSKALRVTSLAQEMEAYLQAHLETGYFIGSVLVAYGGEILLSKGYGMANLEHSIPNAPLTKFRIGSVTKQFTAAAILKLQEQNLLDVNNSVATYIPDYPNGGKITIHQLLTHTSGIPNYTNFDDFESKKTIKMELDELIAYFSHRPLEFPSGEKFNYSNSGYVVLTKIIETVSNQSYADYLQEYIFTPLGMNDSGYDRHETILQNRASGYVSMGEEYKNAQLIDMSLPSGAGALYSTVEDLYKWDCSLNTDIVLNKLSRDAMFSPQIKVIEDENEQVHYGYGWLLDTIHDRHRISHNGGIDGFSSHFSRFPNEQITIVVLSNLVTSPVEKIGRDLTAIILGESYELPKKREAIDLDPAIYENYVGQYKFEPSESQSKVNDITLTVTTQSQRIFIQWFGGPVIEIFPESPTKFFRKIVDAQLTFVTDNDGKASQLIFHQNGRDMVLNRID